MNKYVAMVMVTLKVILALLMIFGGVSTALGPLQPGISELVNNRLTLVAFGFFFILAGTALLMGIFLRNRRLVSRSLMLIYLVTLFTVFLEWAATGLFLSTIDNLIVVVWAAGLWLWWKQKTEWLSGREVADLRREVKELER